MKFTELLKTIFFKPEELHPETKKVEIAQSNQHYHQVILKDASIIYQNRLYQENSNLSQFLTIKNDPNSDVNSYYLPQDLVELIKDHQANLLLTPDQSQLILNLGKETQKTLLDFSNPQAYPTYQLTFLERYSFEFENFRINSLTNFLVALNYQDPAKQAEILQLDPKNIRQHQIQSKQVYWQNQKYPINSPEIQAILQNAYQACLKQNPGFYKILKDFKDTDFIINQENFQPNLTNQAILDHLKALKDLI